MKAPTLFISHGAPSLALEPGPSREFLTSLSTRLGQPRAIACISAHWTTQMPTVSLASHPDTIHDFYGFPPELYNLRYPAPGDPELAQQILQLLSAAKIEAYSDPDRGFDHGVWSPLILIFPGANIPVVELSVQPNLDAAHHLRVGQALAPLRDENILVMGSGSTTHNLRELGRSHEAFIAFENWVCDAIVAGRTEDLIQFETRAPHARRNHPTPEHFLPLFAPLGAAGNEAQGEILNRHFELGSLSMAAFLWQ